MKNQKDNIVEHVCLDEERALYASKNLIVRDVAFDGPADGESALKESENIQAERCYCNLRYPFWHVKGLRISNTQMTSLCRAAIWYSENVCVSNTKLYGIKAVRECKNVSLANCDIASPEFGWSVSGISMTDCTAESEYFMMRSCDIRMKNVKLTGKYSFQYIENATFEHCVFNTKDAFWHAKNVYVKNCVVKGEYLGWYSENVTFENCTIIGTQPLCYCKGLKLISCRMQDADLCFERSEVEAEILTPVISVKNVYRGRIELPAVEEVIRDDENALAAIIADGKTL